MAAGVRYGGPRRRAHFMNSSSSPGRWLMVVLCGVVCACAAVPGIAAWQESKPAAADKQKKPAEDKQDRRRKRYEKQKSRAEEQQRTTPTPGVRVVPMDQGPKPSSNPPSAPQTGPGARPGPPG